MKCFSMLSLFASLALIVGISVEIISGYHTHFSKWYMILQLCVCLIFLVTALLRLLDEGHYRRRRWGNMLFIILSVPYLNILDWSDAALPHDLKRVVGFLPLLMSILAMIVIVNWLISGRAKRLLAAYLLTVVVFTYIAALIFYDYEWGVNPHLTSFGNALWWAWMNVTTVGAAIFPVTAIGKIVSVILPAVGMMFFPIFTVYVSQYYTRPENGKSGKE